jgi:two-component system, NtrC family, sensor histidine kinase HydH
LVKNQQTNKPTKPFKLKGSMKNSDTLRLTLLSSFIIGISLLHYLTPLRLPMLHDIFQRLYYIPIILAAFWFGFRGGLVSALLVSILYAPHVLFQWGGHMTMELEKYLEILLYNVVGCITGLLSQREHLHASRLRETARGLEESYNKLQRQADLIIEIEEQLRRAERLSVLGELSAALAHEVRNPLGSIRGAAEILMDDYRPGDRKYEFCQILLKESVRLNHVVEDYLRLARPQPVESRNCDVVEELRTIVVLLSAEAKRRGVRLEIMAESLPSVEGDPEKLRQAFLNIIMNGLQATPEGGNVTISASHTKSNETESAAVVIDFSDSGSGIEPDKHGQVFEPFYTTKAGGTGLGLAVTKKIIECHGGRISIINTPGCGACFQVVLPAATEGK